jgi:hypothetical protein
MSERESKFLNWLSGILGTFLITIAIGAFSLARHVEINDAVQDEKLSSTEKKVETMRLEWREDIKEIKMNIDKIATEKKERSYSRSKN